MKTNHSRRSNPAVLPSMANSKALLRASKDLSFEAVRTDANDNTPMSGREVELNDECQPSAADLGAAVNKEEPDKVNNCLIGNSHDKNADMLAREVKCALRKSGANEMASMIEEALDDVLREVPCNA